ncbi:MAG: HlyD family efflux transporter periplasmic adaptor subunit [Polyangiaceae bacterium]
MATPFQTTLRTLRAGAGLHPAAWLIGASVLLAGWIAWFVLSEVAARESSSRASVAAGRGPHQVNAPAAGLVASSRLVLGAVVHRGEVLVTLDDTADRATRVELEARLGAVSKELDALERSMQARARQGASEREVAERAATEQQARNAAVDAEVELALLEAERAAKGFEGGTGSRAELERAEANHTRLVAELAAGRAGLGRRQREVDVVDATTASALEEIALARTRVVGQGSVLRGELDALVMRARAAEIVAPIDGTIAAVDAGVLPGSHVAVDQNVATIVPSDALKVVAEFDVKRAARLAPGQTARLRVDGFDWTRYGVVELRVEAVGTEPRDGLVQVELSVVDAPQRFRLRGGLTGTVDVEVERASPWSMVARELGDWAVRTQ